MRNGEAKSFGEMSYKGASALVVSGAVGATIGGYGPGYDLVRPFRITETGIEPVGSALRVVKPDGLEVRDRWTFCRGSEMHVIVGTGWYRLNLEDIVAPR